MIIKIVYFGNAFIIKIVYFGNVFIINSVMGLLISLG